MTRMPHQQQQQAANDNRMDASNLAAQTTSAPPPPPPPPPQHRIVDPSRYIRHTSVYTIPDNNQHDDGNTATREATRELQQQNNNPFYHIEQGILARVESIILRGLAASPPDPPSSSSSSSSSSALPKLWLVQSDNSIDVGDRNMYTGVMGVAYAFLHLHLKLSCRAQGDESLQQVSSVYSRLLACLPEVLQRAPSGIMRHQQQQQGEESHPKDFLDLALHILKQEEHSSSSGLLHRPINASLLRKGVGFYCGTPGYFSVATVAHALKGNTDLARLHYDKLIQIAKYALVHRNEVEAEPLYGLGGLLYALRFPTMVLGSSSSSSSFFTTVDPSVVRSICDVLLDEGFAYGRQKNHHRHRHNSSSDPEGGGGCPVGWPWHGKTYLGAAHGVVGVTHSMLLWWDELTNVDDNDIEQEGEQTMRTRRNEALMSIVEWVAREVSSHDHRAFPFSEDSSRCAHHFCHGCPGTIPLLLKAHTTLSSSSSSEEHRRRNMSRATLFLDAAKHVTEIIFQEGLLAKGTGICHGSFSSAYMFLSMYRVTRDAKYLFYANEFERMTQRTEEYRRFVRRHDDPQRRIGNVPDSPFSLMEGVAGEMCYLVDLMYPTRSHFPGYEECVPYTL